jgi:hypothetical protein
VARAASPVFGGSSRSFATVLRSIVSTSGHDRRDARRFPGDATATIHIATVNLPGFARASRRSALVMTGSQRLSHHAADAVQAKSCEFALA